jgi:hypothetical protein
VPDVNSIAQRLAALERRVELLERRALARSAVDDEINSLEHRLDEVREHEDG